MHPESVIVLKRVPFFRKWFIVWGSDNSGTSKAKYWVTESAYRYFTAHNSGPKWLPFIRL